MGYLSCRADSAVITCESYKREKPVARPPVQVFQHKQLESATGGFGAASLLGKGSHGSVYRGVLADGAVVAVKRASRGLRLLQQDDAAMENEIEILSKLYSPRLVNLLGFSHDAGERLLVVEFMPNGTLHEALHSQPEPPGWARRVHLALHTAKAILALHTASPPVIHRDIKSSNVLIDAHGNARLGDFGLALRGHVEEIRLNSTPPAGTIGYLDPGYLTPGNVSTKNDVFSFGILLLEIISGRNAIDVHYSPPSIVEWAIPLVRQNRAVAMFDPRLPQHPKNADSLRKVALIAARCVRSAEDKRPSIKDVVDGLKHVCRSLPLPLPLWNGRKKSKKAQAPTISETRKDRSPEKSIRFGPKAMRSGEKSQKSSQHLAEKSGNSQEKPVSISRTLTLSVKHSRRVSDEAVSLYDGLRKSLAGKSPPPPPPPPPLLQKVILREELALTAGMKPSRSSSRVSDDARPRNGGHSKGVGRRGSGRNLGDLFSQMTTDDLNSDFDGVLESARSPRVFASKQEALPVFGDHRNKFERYRSSESALGRPPGPQVPFSDSRRKSISVVYHDKAAS